MASPAVSPVVRALRQAAEDLSELIEERGFHRGKALVRDLEEILREPR